MGAEFAQVQRNSFWGYTEGSFAHCGVFAVCLDIRKIETCVQSRASCDFSGVDGAGKSLDEDRMTVLEPGRFGIGGQPTI